MHSSRSSISTTHHFPPTPEEPDSNPHSHANIMQPHSKSAISLSSLSLQSNEQDASSATLSIYDPSLTHPASLTYINTNNQSNPIINTSYTSSSTSTPSALTPSFHTTPSQVELIRQSLPIFRNQVAGHTTMFWHSGTICKPLIPAEHEFYARLEREMKGFMSFVPKFYGVMDLERLTEEMASSMVSSGEKDQEEEGKSKIDVISLPPSSSVSATSSPTTFIPKLEPEYIASPTQYIPPINQSTASTSISSTSSSTSTSSSSSSSSTSTTASISTSSSARSPPETLEKAMTHNNRPYNKWAMKCQLRKPSSSRQQIQYIVLEDLTFAYAKPCILDLKIGTRQHADTESPAKIASKTARCLNTTSSTLGLRLCGMQVYHPSTGTYLFRDKYYGRSLVKDSFRLAMRDFFYDGDRLLIELIQAFIQRTEKFRRAILDLTKGRRFYSSSLLLIYEGDKNIRGLPKFNYTLTQSTPNNSTERRESGENSNNEVEEHGASIDNFPLTLNSPTGELSSASEPSKSQFIPNSNRQISIPSPLVSPPSAYHSPATSPASSIITSGSSNGPSSSSIPTSTPALSTESATNIVSPHMKTQFASPLNRYASLPSSFSSSAFLAVMQAAGITPAVNTSNIQTPINTPLSTITASPPSTPNDVKNSPPPTQTSSFPIKLYSRKRKTTHAQAMALAKQRGNIDVRIIDFAHTSVVPHNKGETEGVSESNKVDESLLFGFDCLIFLLKELIAREKELIVRNTRSNSTESKGSPVGEEEEEKKESEAQEEKEKLNEWKEESKFNEYEGKIINLKRPLSKSVDGAQEGEADELNHRNGQIVEISRQLSLETKERREGEES